MQVIAEGIHDPSPSAGIDMDIWGTGPEWRFGSLCMAIYYFQLPSGTYDLHACLSQHTYLLWYIYLYK